MCAPNSSECAAMCITPLDQRNIDEAQSLARALEDQADATRLIRVLA